MLRILRPAIPGAVIIVPAMIPCQSCKKRPATVHLTEIVKGEKREVHLCEECAQSEGINPLTPQSFFSHLVDASKGATGEELEITCPNCGLTYAEFRQRGRLGCGEDYKLFKEGLTRLLEKIHGSTQHLGRIPTRIGSQLERETELIELKRELTRVVQREEYEKAAGIRDRIRELEEEEDAGESV